MENSWTEEQKRAISERGRNILVSAGAGSGKTAVMVERAVRLIMDDRVPVSSMLILTFTKAAASEMKDRLRKSLKDRLAEAGVQAEEQSWIKEQLDRLGDAQISTFHSFAQRILREFFYLTDVEPGFRALDDAEAEVLKEQAVDDLFEAEYEEKREDFISFMDSYSGEKSDFDAKELISELYGKLEAVPDRFAVLDEKIAELDTDAGRFRDSETYRKLFSFVEKQADRGDSSAEKAEKLLREAGLPRMADLIAADREWFLDAKALLKEGDLDKASEMMRDAGFKTVGASKSKNSNESDLYDIDIKNRLSVLRNDYKDAAASVRGLCYDSVGSMVKSLKMTHGFALTISRLVKRMDSLYSASKRDMNAIDYSDMERYAIEILRHEEAAEYYRDLFRYIFIDEYQDTNIMQETIIGMIRREDDLFMVGDIKQSIYHFRLADPEIFAAKYAAYKEEGLKGDKAGSVKIDLNRNFRSRSRVIDEVNRIFRPVMEGYDEDAELRCGTEDGKYLLPPPETHIIDIEGMKADEDEEFAEMHKEELEALETARIIRGLIGKEYTDPKTGLPKKTDYRDIVILMRSIRKIADTFREVFREQGIPVYVDDRDGYFDTIEINVFLSLLTVIDNKRQDVPFIAVLRSEIFGFTLKELAEIRKLCPDGSFIDAAAAAAENENAPGYLRDKCAHAFSCIRRWQAYAVTMPLSDLIWRLMNETGYYITVGAFPGGAGRQANLRLLADRARDYSERSLGTLYGFIRYIETLKKSNVDMPQAALLSENDNVVRIMTIHHSKGLEFPVVIVAGMDNSHNGNSTKTVCFDREEGLGLRAVDPVRHLYEDGLISRMISAKEKKAETDELKRVFYVAVTRARETFYLVGAAKYDSIIDGIDAGVHSDATLMKLSAYLPHIVRVDRQDLKEDIPGRSVKEPDIKAVTADAEEIARKLGYEYPYPYALDTPAKTTATRLNEARREIGGTWEDRTDDVDPEEEKSPAEEQERFEDDMIPEFMKGRSGITAAEKGTAYHGVMERADFTKAAGYGEAYIIECMDGLVRDGVFTEEEMKAVDPEKIRKFFDTDLGKRAAAAAEKGVLYKELPFESKVLVNGEDVLVQGVIDCCFEEPDGIVLVDYKTNYIDRKKGLDKEAERMRELYTTQLSAYARAIQKAMGKTVKERYLYLFGADTEVSI